MRYALAVYRLHARLWKVSRRGASTPINLQLRRQSSSGPEVIYQPPGAALHTSMRLPRWEYGYTSPGAPNSLEVGPVYCFREPSCTWAADGLHNLYFNGLSTSTSYPITLILNPLIPHHLLQHLFTKFPERPSRGTSLVPIWTPKVWKNHGLRGSCSRLLAILLLLGPEHFLILWSHSPNATTVSHTSNGPHNYDGNYLGLYIHGGSMNNVPQNRPQYTTILMATYGFGPDCPTECQYTILTQTPYNCPDP